MRVGINPLSIDIRQIALADFFVRIGINEDRTLNLQNILEKEAGKDEAAQETQATPVKVITQKDTEGPAANPPVKAKGEPQKIRIDAITLQGGTIDFIDRSVKPNYAANLAQIGGRVSGISSIGEKPADVELRGQFNNHMPMEITGKISPLQRDLFADLKASFKDMDLSTVSPYSARHIGYNIQKGKLSFDLKYLIVNKKLTAENKVFIDQLTLGEPVESPQALKLPIGLAIALLKDRRGQIDLDIPIEGTTDDPKFSVWGLIVKVLVNLVTKAATAPFALLGSLFGGGEELSYVEFDYGRAEIADAGLKKIETLVKALYERPSLKLDIEGHADLERDREGLKTAALERKVKSVKLNDMIKKGLPVVPVDSIRIDPQEYEKYLTQAYLAEPFPKPRTVIGLVKTLPVAEMEKLILTHAVIKEGDLKLLADRRAQAVNNAILKSGKVPPERVFIVEPKSLAPEKKDKVKDSRIDFRLK
ncbi:MAG: DUF748 domain-containing protein, partial [Syntrophales bacterium]|nr:DUF748 domain-containing protein [Syntrophales bacterium]